MSETDATVKSEIVDGRLKVHIDIKENPNHDQRGRFASGGGSGGSSARVSVKVSVDPETLGRLKRKADKEEIQQTAVEVEKSLAGVAERCQKLTDQLPKSEMGIRLKGTPFWISKNGQGATTGQYDKETGTAEVAGFGHPATSDHLKGGQFSLSDAVSDIATHEFGHHLLEQMLAANGGKGVGEPGRLVNIWKVTPKSELRKLSQYAADHPAEMFCEGLLAYTHPSYGTKNGAKMPKALAKYFDDVIGKGK